MAVDFFFSKLLFRFCVYLCQDWSEFPKRGIRRNICPCWRRCLPKIKVLAGIRPFARSPFGPGWPRTPGSPLAPSFPFTPVGPRGPMFPGLPGSPFGLLGRHGLETRACREYHHNRMEEMSVTIKKSRHSFDKSPIKKKKIIIIIITTTTILGYICMLLMFFVFYSVYIFYFLFPFPLLGQRNKKVRTKLKTAR